MNEYARKIANPTKFFIGGEWVDVSSDTFNGVISLLAEDYSSGSSISNEPVALDFGAGNGNRDHAEGFARFSKRLNATIPVIEPRRDYPASQSSRLGRAMGGADPQRNSRDFASDPSQGHWTYRPARSGRGLPH